MENEQSAVERAETAEQLRRYLDAINATLEKSIDATARLDLCDFRRTVESALRATINKDGAYNGAIIRIRQQMAFGSWEQYAQMYNLEI